MDRGRGRRYDDRDSGYGGETYRPSDRMRSPPRHNGSYRGPRSPTRRARTPPPYDNGYSSRGRGRSGGRMEDRARSRSPPRRRSRSPILNGRDDEVGYRGGARSPPRTAERPRSPPLFRRKSRSPYGGRLRAKSPFSARRARDVSPPTSYRQHSPPPKQGRYADNADRDDYARRPYPPVREEHRRFPQENNYRPKERSRTPVRVSTHTSRGASPDSRHSSGPVHADRLDRVSDRMPDRMPDRAPDRLVDRMADRTRNRSPAFRSPRHDPISDRRSPPRHPRDHSLPRRQISPQSRSPLRQEPQERIWRDRSPPPRQDTSWRDRSPPSRQEPSWGDPSPRLRDRELPSRDRGTVRNASTPNTWSKSQMAASSFSNGDSRPPPTGPSSRHESYSRDGPPPASPAAPGSVALHGRGAGNISAAPTRPRDSRDVPFRGRGGRHFNSGPPTPRNVSYDPTSIPTGPRSSAPSYSANSPPPSRYDSGPRSSIPSGPPFRSNNSSSTTYPRTQRFNNANSAANHLALLPQALDGGKKAPSALEPSQERRLAQLEEDKRRLLDAIEEKQRIKRQGLREWEKAERESARDGLKSELAESHLESMSGEIAGSGAY